MAKCFPLLCPLCSLCGHVTSWSAFRAFYLNVTGSDESSSKHDVASVLRSLCGFRRWPSFIKQAYQPCGPFYCQKQKLISHSEQWRRWYSRLVLQGNSVMLRIYDKCPNWSPLSTSAGVKCENKNAGLHKLCRIRSFYWQRNDNKSTFLHDIMFSKLTTFDLGLGNMVSE